MKHEIAGLNGVGGAELQLQSFLLAPTGYAATKTKSAHLKKNPRPPILSVTVWWGTDLEISVSHPPTPAWSQYCFN